MSKRIEYQKGQKIGPLVLIKEVQPVSRKNSRGYYRFARFMCSCGNEFNASITSVNRGSTRSCGCARKGINSTHGLYGTPLQKRWTSIKNRCYNVRSQDYPRYGGRGITVFEEWRNDLLAFYNYAMALPDALKESYTIDRIENDGNYEPGNIQWATKHQQTANRTYVKNKTGYLGIKVVGEKFAVYIGRDRKTIYLGTFETLKEAVESRNNYIIENNLTEYNTQEWIEH